MSLQWQILPKELIDDALIAVNAFKDLADVTSMPIIVSTL
jgi:hypothetical protein